MLEPILPPDNSIMRLLSSPLPPTSSPLYSSRNDLRLILEELRKVCAPVRDDEVDATLRDTYTSDREEDLPALLVNTFRSTMQLIEEMRSDIRSFTVANLEEESLRKLLVSEARRREVLLVARLYGGELGITKPWVDWISSPLASTTASLSPVESIAARSKAWIPILMKGLSSSTPVSILRPSLDDEHSELGSSPTSPPHDISGGIVLPPPFLIPLPSLFRIQDLTQALVVTACLRIIAQSALPRPVPNTPPTSPRSRSPFPSTPLRRTSTPFSPTSPSSPSPSPAEALEEFTARVWSLVEAEVERGGHVEAETKLVNLEDEVWRLRKQYLAAANPSSTSKSYLTSGPPTPTSSKPGSTPVRSQSPARQDSEEKRVRAQVQQLLRLDDKVFNLLQNRVIKALTEWLTTPPPSTQTRHSGPIHMRTGMRRPGTLFATSPSWGDPHAPDPSTHVSGVTIPPMSTLPNVPGFEGKALRKALENVARDLAVVVGWVKETWGGVVALEPRPAPVLTEGELASSAVATTVTGALTAAVAATGNASTGDERRTGTAGAGGNATSTTPRRS